MGGIEARDRILAIANEVASVAELRTHALVTLRDAVGCDGVMFRPGARWMTARPVYLDASVRFTDLYQAEPLRYRRELAPWCELSRGERPFLYDDVYGTSARERSLVFNEMMRPARVRHLLGAPVVFRGATMGLLFIFRRSGARAFASRNMATAEALASTLAVAEAALRSTLPASPPAESDLAQTLPERERRVAHLFADGLSSKEIAGVVGTSFHTVRKQIANAFERLGVHDRRHLALALRASGSPSGDRRGGAT